MVDQTPFDPPVSDPEELARRRVRPVYIAPPTTALDPVERVRQGFQQTRIEDRRLDSPWNWLPSGPNFPTVFDRKSHYYAPLDPGGFTSDEFPRVDMNTRLGHALGSQVLDEEIQRRNEIAAREHPTLTLEEAQRQLQMREYNKRQEAKRRGRKAGS